MATSRSPFHTIKFTSNNANINSNCSSSFTSASMMLENEQELDCEADSEAANSSRKRRRKREVDEEAELELEDAEEVQVRAATLLLRKAKRRKLIGFDENSNPSINLMPVHCLLLLLLIGSWLARASKAPNDVIQRDIIIQSSSNLSRSSSATANIPIKANNEPGQQAAAPVEVLEGQVIEQRTSNRVMLELNLGFGTDDELALQQANYNNNNNNNEEIAAIAGPSDDDGQLLGLSHRIGKRNSQQDNASSKSNKQANGSPVFTNQFVIQVEGGEQEARKVAQKHGFVYLNHILDDYYHLEQARLLRRSILSPPSPQPSQESSSLIAPEAQYNWTAGRIENEPKVLMIERQMLKRRVKRDFLDPAESPPGPKATLREHHEIERSDKLFFLSREQERGAQRPLVDRRSFALLTRPANQPAAQLAPGQQRQSAANGQLSPANAQIASQVEPSSTRSSFNPFNLLSNSNNQQQQQQPKQNHYSSWQGNAPLNFGPARQQQPGQSLSPNGSSGLTQPSRPKQPGSGRWSNSSGGENDGSQQQQQQTGDSMLVAGASSSPRHKQQQHLNHLNQQQHHNNHHHNHDFLLTSETSNSQAIEQQQQHQSADSINGNNNNNLSQSQASILSGHPATPNNHHHQQQQGSSSIPSASNSSANTNYNGSGTNNNNNSRTFDHAPFNDPSWPLMWYLDGGAKNGFDLNVMAAWRMGYTGKGIVITILDDGLEKDHPDLQANYDPLASFDINGDDADPMPRYDANDSNRHGTRCAGEVAAVPDNNICSIGIAYNSKVGGVRMLDGEVTDAVEARSLGLNNQHIHIYSASWGPDDNGRTVDGPGELATKAFIDGVTFGRQGLGSIFVFASGNGGREHDNCNCDGYTNSIWTLSISSATENGLTPWYIEYCSSTLATTYSSGAFEEKQIATTDLHHSCTSSHTGTSASAPLAAGICALVLESNPSLTWRDMQHIVVRTAKPANLVAKDWRTNALGRNVSHAFGYGLMDAAAMINLARQWTTVPTQYNCVINLPALDKFIPPKGSIELKLNATCPTIRFLEHVQSKISLSATRRGDLHIYLVSPLGTRSTLLATRPNDQAEQGFKQWPFMTVHSWGESPNGIWTLEVHNDGKPQNRAHLREWTMIMYGTQEDPNLHLNSRQPNGSPATPGVAPSNNHHNVPPPINRFASNAQHNGQQPTTVPPTLPPPINHQQNHHWHQSHQTVRPTSNNMQTTLHPSTYQQHVPAPTTSTFAPYLTTGSTLKTINQQQTTTTTSPKLQHQTTTTTPAQTPTTTTIQSPVQTTTMNNDLGSHEHDPNKADFDVVLPAQNNPQTTTTTTTASPAQTTETDQSTAKGPSNGWTVSNGNSGSNGDSDGIMTTTSPTNGNRFEPNPTGVIMKPPVGAGGHSLSSDNDESYVGLPKGARLPAPIQPNHGSVPNEIDTNQIDLKVAQISKDYRSTSNRTTSTLNPGSGQSEMDASGDSAGDGDAGASMKTMSATPYEWLEQHSNGVNNKQSNQRNQSVHQSKDKQRQHQDHQSSSATSAKIKLTGESLLVYLLASITCSIMVITAMPINLMRSQINY